MIAGRSVGAEGAVAGVDGCGGAWLVVRRGPPGTGPAGGADPAAVRPTSAKLVAGLGPVVDELRRGLLAAVAIDMPIGLLDRHPRICEVEARRLLGPRRSSVFPSPIRAVLDAADYDEARRISRAAVDRAPSRQAFNLVPAIRHLDHLVEPGDQERLVEAHPELAFARLAGAPLPHPDGPDRKAAAQALGHRDGVRTHAGGFKGIESAGPPKTRRCEPCSTPPGCRSSTCSTPLH